MIVGRFDYLRISSVYNHTLGVYCGQKTGQTVLITGDYAVIAFHSDFFFGKRGFFLLFTVVPIGRYIRISISYYPSALTSVIKSECASSHPLSRVRSTFSGATDGRLLKKCI